MKTCDCCGKRFDPNDDAETHNGGSFGESTCFACYNGDTDTDVSMKTEE